MGFVCDLIYIESSWLSKGWLKSNIIEHEIIDYYLLDWIQSYEIELIKWLDIYIHKQKKLKTTVRYKEDSVQRWFKTSNYENDILKNDNSSSSEYIHCKVRFSVLSFQLFISFFHR